MLCRSQLDIIHLTRNNAASAVTQEEEQERVEEEQEEERAKVTSTTCIGYARHSLNYQQSAKLDSVPVLDYTAAQVRLQVPFA